VSTNSGTVSLWGRLDSLFHVRKTGREIPPDCTRGMMVHKRMDKSKLSDTIRGVIGLGTKILYTIRDSVRESCVAANLTSDEKLIVFCRYPEPGTTKTRLIPALGEQGAADYHRLLTELTVDKARDVCRSHRNSGNHSRRTLEIHYTGGDATSMADWLGADLAYVEQSDGDLGRRMHDSFQKAFREGVRRAVLIGVDAPALSKGTLNEAFRALGSHDLVLGPSEDGGYHLIGLSRPSQHLFEGISWGTDTVMEETLRRAKEQGFSCATTEPRKDVDRPEDLILHPGRRLPMANAASGEIARPIDETISVIIPTLNEGSDIAGTMATVTGFGDVEILVVDGGSTDKTVEIAAAAGATVLSGTRGRAPQMNLGALAARGEFLVFLHGDTRLPEGWIDHVRRELHRPDVVAGAFELRIDSDRRGLRLIERLANFRSKVLGMPYGDQAIFIKANTFRALGGFPNQPIMEDFELMKRLRKVGRIRIAPAAVFTSARRWRKRGIWTMTAVNQLLILAYLMGVSPKRLDGLRER
jgi:uncharacterized protein